MLIDYTNKSTFIYLSDIKKKYQLKIINKEMSVYDLEMSQIHSEQREKVKRMASKFGMPSYFVYDNKKMILISV